MISLENRVLGQLERRGQVPEREEEKVADI
jgi:hypothetical protein